MKTIAKRIRTQIVKTVSALGGGHLGGSLSAVEILTALYFKQLRIDPTNPQDPERDRFILSKGHAAIGYYATLAERGYFSPDELLTYGSYGSRLQGHPDMHRTPGVDMSTGSLGQGLSVGAGLALAAKLQTRQYLTYVLLGDGECEEGQVWEAAQFAAAHHLNNLIAIVDYNKLSQTGPTAPFLGDLKLRWQSHGWAVAEVDGHDFDELLAALQPAPDQPKVVIAHTVKGKGISFMEGQAQFHSSPLTAEQTQQALQELGVTP